MEKAKRKRVFVTVPLAAKEHLCDEVAKVLMALREDDRCAVNVEFPCSSPSEATRSEGLKLFLESDHDHWLQIDSDNPPPGNLLDLVPFLDEKPIIGLPTPLHQHTRRGHPTLTYNAYHSRAMGYQPIEPETEDFEEVDAVGTGCIFISARVFGNAAMRKQPFQRVWRDDGTVQLGSDLAFCERAKHCGFPIWVHWGYRCSHFSTVNLAEMMWLRRTAWDAGYAAGERKRECETSSES